MTNNKRPGIMPGLFVWKLPGIKEKYSGADLRQRKRERSKEKKKY